MLHRPEAGLFTGEGRGFAGEVVYRDLGVPPEVFEPVQAAAHRMALGDRRGVLGPRPHDSHKGSFGHVLIVGGDRGFAGAVRLAGEAAGRTGAGLVSIASRLEHVAALASSRPELMVRGIESPDALEPLIGRASVIAVGPGLGQDSWGVTLLEAVTRTDRALVVDADAINLLSRGAVAWPDATTRSVVYTPHPGRRAACWANRPARWSRTGSNRCEHWSGCTRARGCSRDPEQSSPSLDRSLECAREEIRAWPAAGWVT